MLPNTAFSHWFKIRYDSNMRVFPTRKRPHFFFLTGIRCIIENKMGGKEMQIILFLQICLIAVGVWSLVMMLYRLFLMPAHEEFAPLVLPVGKEGETVEARLRWAFWQTRSGGRYGRLYVLDCGMDGETLQICEKFAAEYGNVEIGDMQTLEIRLESAGHLQG